MRVILDECLPRRLLRDLPDHVVTTVPRQGWAGVTNGALLKRVQNEFDVFVTMDSNIVYQQNLDGLKTCLVVLHAVNSRYETLQPCCRRLRMRYPRQHLVPYFISRTNAWFNRQR